MPIQRYAGGTGNAGGGYTVKSYGGPSEPGQTTGSRDNTLQPGDVAISPNMASQYPFGSTIYFNDANGNPTSGRVADTSYYSPGNPTSNTIELFGGNPNTNYQTNLGGSGGGGTVQGDFSSSSGPGYLGSDGQIHSPGGQGPGTGYPTQKLATAGAGIVGGILGNLALPGVGGIIGNQFASRLTHRLTRPNPNQAPDAMSADAIHGGDFGSGMSDAQWNQLAANYSAAGSSAPVFGKSGFPSAIPVGGYHLPPGVTQPGGNAGNWGGGNGTVGMNGQPMATGAGSGIQGVGSFFEGGQNAAFGLDQAMSGFPAGTSGFHGNPRQLSRGGVIPNASFKPVPAPALGRAVRGYSNASLRPPTMRSMLPAVGPGIMGELGMRQGMGWAPGQKTPVMRTGGMVRPAAVPVQGYGTDTVPTMLTPGEAVFNKQEMSGLMPRPGYANKLRPDQLMAIAHAIR
jgi:hypothetical protein